MWYNKNVLIYFFHLQVVYNVGWKLSEFIYDFEENEIIIIEILYTVVFKRSLGLF